MRDFARNYENDLVDVIISDYMSEANMVNAAGRRVDQASPNTAAPPIIPTTGPATTAAYEAVFLEALEPALENLQRYGIKVAVNAGASDTAALHKVVVEMIEKKGLSLKVDYAMERPS